MCIIAVGKKKNMLRKELVTGMKSNPSGFWTLVLRDKEGGGREIVAEVRTLKEEEALKPFDEAQPEDWIVSHSRIPSHGEKSLDNVHGWECEGVRFAHNGTMSNVSKLMEKTDKRTDSEWFFREIFIPLWKSQGRNINDLVTKVIGAVRDSSRFCFVMPDGEIKLFGDFVKDHDCWFSNSGYKSTYNYGYGYGYGRYDYDYEGFENYRVVKSESTQTKEDTPTSCVEPLPDSKLEHAALEAIGGTKKTAQMVFRHLALSNGASLLAEDMINASETPNWTLSDEISSGIDMLLPSFMQDEYGKDFNSLFETWLCGSPLDQFSLKEFLEDYISGLSDAIGALYSNVFKKGDKFEDVFKADLMRMTAASRMVNVSFDWTMKTFPMAVISWKQAKGCVPKMIRRTPMEILSVYPTEKGRADTEAWKKMFPNLELLYKWAAENPK